MQVTSGRSIVETERLAVRGDGARWSRDEIASEEPLEIRAQGPEGEATRIAVTMRTPGHDDELAVGFLFTEALLHGRDELGRPAVRELLVEGSPGNVVTVRLTRSFDATRLQRNFYATSSCGICGKASLDHIQTEAPPIAPGPTLARSTLAALPQKLRAAQDTFERTGGLHAAALFDESGALLAAREDVGRHNALDKVVGRAVLDRSVPLARHVVLVSGRASFELVQKAAMAGAPILCAVSAPSSLAVQAAERLGMTLVGFLRGDGFNVYANPQRIDLNA